MSNQALYQQKRVTAEEALRRVRSVESQYVQSELQENILVAYEEMLLEKMG